MSNAELDAIQRLDTDQANRFWAAIGSMRDPVCCSLVADNRFRLVDYALKHYVSGLSTPRALIVRLLSEIGNGRDRHVQIVATGTVLRHESTRQ